MTAKYTRWAYATGFAVLSPLWLGGCFGMPDHSAASADVVGLQSTNEVADAVPPIRTVKRSGSRVAAADPADESVPRGSGVPSPREIFDFHPPGSKPEAWRQPFIIDPNDGPLAGYVRHMDAELAESKRETRTAAQAPLRKKVCPSTGPAGTIATGCGENDVAKSLAR